MSIVIWLCFAIMIAILATSIVNIARRGRADRLEYYKNYKKGKFWAIYFVAIPLFYLANKFNGSTADEAFFDAVKSSVDLVVLKYDYSAVKPLMEANSAFKAVMWLCFVMVALNASFLAVTIVYRRVQSRLERTCQKRKEVFRSGRLQSAKQEHSQIHCEKRRERKLHRRGKRSERGFEKVCFC